MPSSAATTSSSNRSKGTSTGTASLSQRFVMVDGMDAAALLDGLNDAQRQAVTSDAAPLVILAGAGSGKTRVLTRRIAYRCATETADPRHVVALTFTRKAAGELGNRLRALGMRDSIVAGTFHAVAYAQLRRSWADRHITPPTLLERKAPFLARLLGRGSGVKAVDVAGEIEWAKARTVAPADYAREALAAGRRPPLDFHALAQLYERYEIERRNRRMVDFDDLLGLCARTIENDPDVAAAQRWLFRHVFVDEFQDVNPLQFRLLEAWRGGRPDLCVVGDPQQAIYGWNGADGRWLEDFTALHPGATVVHLRRSHRSSPQIVGLGHAVLTGSGEGGPVASRPDGTPPRTIAFADPEAEAAGVAAIVRDVRPPGGRWRAIAVLARTNAQ